MTFLRLLPISSKYCYIANPFRHILLEENHVTKIEKVLTTTLIGQMNEPIRSVLISSVSSFQSFSVTGIYNDFLFKVM